MLAVNTTARKCELRAIQWRHVDFINRNLEIPKSKTEAGVRVVPLNAESHEALLTLRRRAEKFGQVELSHFVFAPFRPKFWFHGKNHVGIIWSEFDPTQPVGSWRTAWRTLTQSIQCNECGYLQKPGKICRNLECKKDIQKINNPLAGLRFHDLRHTAISALGEAGVPDRVIMDIAGHIHPRMLRRYSHTQPRIQAGSNSVAVQPTEGRNFRKV